MSKDSAGEVTKKGRTLVLCFDGTSNEYDSDNTNVIKFFSLLKKDDFNEQLCYYQAGIGTFFNPGVVSPIFEWCAKILDQAIAWYLDHHVMDGYRFLMQNYRVGDKICVFGFSRGAYTARALAGMLYKVGLLPRDNQEQIPFAYKLYKREDKEGVQLSSGFKQTFCQDVKIEFVGVWDTVSSVGVIMGKTLPFTNSNTAIKTFRHALALDERRAKFRPNNYHYTAPTPQAAEADPQHASNAKGDPEASSPPGSGSGSDTDSSNKDKKNGLSIFQRLSPKLKCKGSKGSTRDSATLQAQPGDTNVLEVWFIGCHSDVGGGNVTDDVTSSVANIPLRWMVREVILSQCGIQFEVAALQRLAIPYVFPTLQLSSDGTVHKVGNEQPIADAMQPIHDALKSNPFWWLLEIIPLHYTWQDAQGVWHRTFSFNFGKGRDIRDEKPNFHSTVKVRMADASLKYKPRAKWTEGTEVYLD
ncbi:hypothetical protein HGRIS_006406 [Hohenbuehelia grisea]|uniref:T6SS Phospholipase effector Tle1-like catalytic domain-containing protein n=1 Tax=Hohenbuehelia grisea TaxID=104357 RepID=A0ABR3K164_9AGAR